MAEKKNQVAKATATDQNAGNAERYRMRKQYTEEVVPALIKRLATRTSTKFRVLKRSFSTWVWAIAKTTANPCNSQSTNSK